MASEAIKRLIMQQMFQQGAAKKQKEQAASRGQFVGGLMGSPAQEQQTEQFQMDTFPGEQQLPGLMDVTQEAAPASGMFNESIPLKQRQMEFNKGLMSSEFPALQEQGFDAFNEMQQGQGDLAGARTFAMGSKDGKMQRAYLGADGQPVTLGQPYDPRNPFLNTGTQFVNPNSPQNPIEIKNKKASFDKAEGAAEGGAKQQIRNKANDILLADYKTESDQSNKYKSTLDTTNRILELGDKVETGRLVGSAPVAYLREMFGDTELQELNALIKGLPLPILKATFGAAFSVSEGEKLSDSLATIKMDAPAFKKAMNRLKTKLVYDERRFKAKERWFQGNQGDLMDYKDKTPYPKELEAYDKAEKNKTVSWDNL